MSYLYYPGCSLKSTGLAYEESVLPVFNMLGVPLRELEDWNCCGATAYMSISELKAFTLSARNLALAQQQSHDEAGVDLIVPCAACYLGLKKAQKYLKDNPEVCEKVDRALRAGGLEYSNNDVRIRHPLDVIVNDVGLDTVQSRVKRPLEMLKVASYYGCQIVRPYADFDDQHHPTSMDRIVEALGADPIDWPIKTRCCGGSLTGTVQEVGQRLSYIILKEAEGRGADVIVTGCPLCQFNLECYQKQMRKRYGRSEMPSVIYFTQLMGTAFGLDKKTLGLHRLFVPFAPVPVQSASAGGEHVHS